MRISYKSTTFVVVKEINNKNNLKTKIMEKVINVATGFLNEFRNFYGNVEINQDKSQEAYDLLEADIPDEIENSPELWSGEFEKDGKKYAIVGDGDLASSGQYVVGEIEKTYDVVFSSETSENNKGFEESLQYCKDYISSNNGTNNSYFEDYKGGIVSIIDTVTDEIVYSEKVR